MIYRTRPSMHGFTMIELMITLVIVAILAALVYPSYQGSVRKSQRNDGQAILLDIVARQGRHLFRNGTYTADLTDLGYATANNVDSAEQYYKVSVLGPTVACPIISCFVIEAVPQGGQAADGRLRIGSNGQKWRDQNHDGDVTDAGEDTW